MAEDEHLKQAVAAARQLEQLLGRIDAMAARLERIEDRLDMMHQEGQRVASATQRMLLRQDSLSKGVGRIEDALRRE